MRPEEINDKIDDYILGRLPAEEREAFDMLIRQNPDLKKEVDHLKLIRKGITQHQRQVLKKHLQQMEPAASGFKWWYAAAALIPLIALCIWYFYPASGESVYYAYYTTYPNYEAGISRNETGSSDNRALAFQLYEKGQFKAAIQQLQTIIDENPEDSPALFYLGLSYLETDSPEKAIPHLKALAEKTSSDYQEAALWYYALAHLKLDNKSEAVNAFSQLENSKTYQGKAKKILSKIR